MITRGVDALRRLALREEGQGLAEYGVMLTLISIIAIATMEAIGIDVMTLFTSAADRVADAAE